MATRVSVFNGIRLNFLPFANDINDGLIPVGLEIFNLEAANFGFS